MKHLDPRYLLLLAALSGCASPAYQHHDAAASALLNLDGRDKNWICVDDIPKRLYPDAAGYARIPAGERLTFWTYLSERRGHCNAHVSFVPTAGMKYQIAVDVTDNRCAMTLVKEDRATRLGVSQEHSADYGPTRCQKQE